MKHKRKIMLKTVYMTQETPFHDKVMLLFYISCLKSLYITKGVTYKTLHSQRKIKELFHIIFSSVVFKLSFCVWSPLLQQASSIHLQHRIQGSAKRKLL